MSVSNEQMQTLMKLSEQRERRARTAALALTIIPLIFGLAFLAYSLWNANRVQQELVTKEEELHTAEVVLQETINKYHTVDTQLAAAAQSVAAAEARANTALSEAESAKAEAALLSTQLEQTDAKVNEYAREITSLQAAVVEKDSSYRALEQQVLLASQLQTERSYDQWQVWLKESLPYFFRLFGNNQAAIAMISRQLTALDSLFQQSPPYNAQGASVEEGFTASSFALHVLREIDRVPQPRTPILEQDALREYLLQNGMQLRPDNQPQPGDLVLYKDGFAMFYFPDPQRRPFVIGMTASGVKVVSPNFAEVVGVFAVLP